MFPFCLTGTDPRTNRHFSTAKRSTERRRRPTRSRALTLEMLEGRALLSGLYTLTPLNVPSANNAAAVGIGINDAGQIVGYYIDASKIEHGFLFNGSTYTTLDVPGAIGTVASGINDAGQIVGYYIDASQIAHGFLFNGSTYTTLDVPGAIGTVASGINGAGQIVGNYGDASRIGHGFLFNGSTYTTLDAPGAILTAASGINGAGQIVGYYIDTSKIGHGFLFNGSTYTTLDAPGAILTAASGINGAGQIVGYYGDTSQIEHGFLFNGSTYTTLDAPNANGTFNVLGGSGQFNPVAINDSGWLVGGTVNYNGVTSGVLLIPSDSTHTPTSPSTPPHVTGIVSVSRSKKGLTAITVGFDEALEQGSVSNLGLYSVLGAVTKHKKTVYTKGVRIKGITFDGNAHVTINLAKPYKGVVQVTVHGGIVATNGASSSGDFTTVVH